MNVPIPSLIMIKVSVLYPHNPAGFRFDHEYYRTKHVPMVVARLRAGGAGGAGGAQAAACRAFSIDKGIGGGVPGAPAPVVAIAHFHADSIEAFMTAFGPHAQEIIADVPNYTDITPVMQISEVVAG